MKNTNRSIANKEAKKGKDFVSVMTSYQGPLPSPEILHGFENVLPGAAERVFKMVENEQAERHKNQRKIITISAISVFVGVLFSFSAVLFVGYLIYYSVKTEAYNVAIALSAIMASVAGVFLYRFSRKPQG